MRGRYPVSMIANRQTTTLRRARRSATVTALNRTSLLVLDEATAMLDPLGRREVLDAVMRLNRQDGVTVILVTHHMEEAARAGRVVVMEAGRIVMQGKPHEDFDSAKETVTLAPTNEPITVRAEY